MLDKVKIKCSGTLYEGENNSDYLYFENFKPDADKAYRVRLRASDGRVYTVPIIDDKVLIGRSVISQVGSISAVLCEKIGDNSYISLSKIHTFPVLPSIRNDDLYEPPTYEQAQNLAERAITYYELAKQMLNGKSAYEIAVENGFSGSEDEWLTSLRGEKGEKGEKGECSYAFNNANSLNDYLIPGFRLGSNANAAVPLNIQDGNQPIHPKVLYFRNKFGGHFFWMAYTPYPNGSDGDENPSIACSDDLVNWITPDGVTNPLDSGNAAAYMSDTHLVYNDTTNKLEIWYRQAIPDDSTEIIYRRCSFDGVNWESREEMYRSHDTSSVHSQSYANIMSPCVIFEDGIYKIWAAAGNPNAVLKYYESPNGKNWTLKAITNLTGWHFDVIKAEDGYEAFVSDQKTGASVSFSKSADGITWKEKTQILTAGASGQWDSSRLYRTCALKLDGTYYVFYTGVRDNVWNIGLTISAVKNDVTSVKGYDSGKLLTADGDTVTELVEEIEALNERIADLSKSIVPMSVVAADDFNSSDWVTGFFENNGIISNEQGLEMFHSRLIKIPETGGHKVTTSIAEGAATLMRVSYFNSAGVHLGYDRGEGFINSGDAVSKPELKYTRSITIDRSKGAYYAISCNTSDKSKMAVS